MSFLCFLNMEIQRLPPSGYFRETEREFGLKVSQKEKGVCETNLACCVLG